MSYVFEKGILGKQDLNLWDGLAAKTFTQSRSDGTTTRTLTLNKIGNTVDVLQVYGGGAAYTSATLNTAIAAISTQVVDIELAPGVWAITADVTIPETIDVIPHAGTIFAVATGKTLTIKGNFLGGDRQYFSLTGTGKVVLPNCGWPNPLWWYDATTGDFSPAITSAVKCRGRAWSTGDGWLCQTHVVIKHSLSDPRIMLTSLDLTNCSSFVIEGDSIYCKLITYAEDVAAVDLTGAMGYEFQNIGIWAQDISKQPTVAFLQSRSTDIVNSQGASFDNVMIYGYFKYGAFYNVAVEVDRYWHPRCLLLTSPNFFMRFDPNNRLGLSSEYATIESRTPWYDSQTVHNIYEAQLSCSGINFNPFMLYGAPDAETTGWSGALNVWGGYVYALHDVGYTNAVFNLRDGFNHLQVRGLQVEGSPSAIVLCQSEDHATPHTYNNIIVEGVGGVIAAGKTTSILVGEDTATIKGFSTQNNSFLMGAGSYTAIIVEGTLKNSFIGPGWASVMPSTLFPINFVSLENSINNTIHLEDSQQIVIDGLDQNTILPHRQPNTLFSSLAIAAGTTAGYIKSTANGRLLIDDFSFAHTASDNFWDLRAITTAAGQYCKVGLLIKKNGTADVIKGTVAANQALAPMPFAGISTVLCGIVELGPSYAGGALDGMVKYDTVGSFK